MTNLSAGVRVLGNPPPADLERLTAALADWEAYGLGAPLNRNAEGVPHILAAALERHDLHPTLIFGGSPASRRARMEEWAEEQGAGLALAEETIVFDPLCEQPPRYALRDSPNPLPPSKSVVSVALPALMTSKEAAAYLAVPEQTLRSWRTREEPPPWVTLGRSIRYRATDIADYIEQNLFQP